MWLQSAPSERIELEGVALRRQTLEDARAITEAISVSREALRPWLPFASDDGAVTEEAQRQRLGEIESRWEHRRAFPYAMHAGEAGLVGLMGLYNKDVPGSLEIGYWLDIRHWGQGVVTRCAAALTEAALALPEVTKVEIHCDQANERSAAVPRRLGFALVRVEDHRIDAPGQTGRSLVWVKAR